MDLVCKVRKLLLLFKIECTLVYAVHHNVVSQLTAGHVVHNQSLFAGVDDFAVIQRFKLLMKLRFLGQFLHGRENFVVDCARAVVKIHLRAHGSRIFLHALGACFAHHGACKVHLFKGCKLFKRRKRVQIFPVDHDLFPP